MGLTAEEKNAIVNTWGVVRQTPLESGLALFKIFLDQNPTYKQYFSFRDVEKWEDLKNDKRLKAHALNVISALSMMVDALDDPEVFMEMIEKNIRSHINRKIQVEQYERLKISFVDTLVAVLGPATMTKETIEAWSKAFNVIIATYNKVKSEL